MDPKKLNQLLAAVGVLAFVGIIFLGKLKNQPEAPVQEQTPAEVVKKEAPPVDLNQDYSRKKNPYAKLGKVVKAPTPKQNKPKTTVSSAEQVGNNPYIEFMKAHSRNDANEEYRKMTEAARGAGGRPKKYTNPYFETISRQMEEMRIKMAEREKNKEQKGNAFVKKSDYISPSEEDFSNPEEALGALIDDADDIDDEPYEEELEIEDEEIYEDEVYDDEPLSDEEAAYLEQEGY